MFLYSCFYYLHSERFLLYMLDLGNTKPSLSLLVYAKIRTRHLCIPPKNRHRRTPTPTDCKTDRSKSIKQFHKFRPQAPSLKKQVYIRSKSSKLRGSHAVFIFGYGSNEDGTWYFMVKNSWSEWGKCGLGNICMSMSHPKGIKVIFGEILACDGESKMMVRLKKELSTN